MYQACRCFLIVRFAVFLRNFQQESRVYEITSITRTNRAHEVTPTKRAVTSKGNAPIVNVNRKAYRRDPGPEPVVHYEHEEIGANYRMSNVLEGIGRAQLDVLEDRVAARRRNFDYCEAALGEPPGATCKSASYSPQHWPRQHWTRRYIAVPSRLCRAASIPMSTT